jgi:urease accessory protein
MYDGGCLSEPNLLDKPGSLQRAFGELRVAAKRFGPETVLDELRQVGCLKARFPRRIVPGWMDVVMLNTGGGVAGGDRLDVAIEVGTGGQATIAAQAAERFYRTRAADAPSRVRTRLTVGDGAALEWLPQETILFDRCALDRRLEVDLAEDARFLGVETLVFGRTAMGELVGQGWLRDLIQVRRGGELLLHDAIRIEGQIDDALQRKAVGAGARVVATIVYVAPETGQKLEALRSSWQRLSEPAYPPSDSSPDRPGRSRSDEPSRERGQTRERQPPLPVEAAASAWNGMLVARILGRDSAAVRAVVIAALTLLREDRPLPRVWLC